MEAIALKQKIIDGLVILRSGEPYNGRWKPSQDSGETGRFSEEVLVTTFGMTPNSLNPSTTCYPAQKLKGFLETPQELLCFATSKDFTPGQIVKIDVIAGFLLQFAPKSKWTNSFGSVRSTWKRNACLQIATNQTVPVQLPAQPLLQPPASAPAPAPGGQPPAQPLLQPPAPAPAPAPGGQPPVAVGGGVGLQINISDNGLAVTDGGNCNYIQTQNVKKQIIIQLPEGYRNLKSLPGMASDDSDDDEKLSGGVEETKNTHDEEEEKSKTDEHSLASTDEHTGHTGHEEDSRNSSSLNGVGGVEESKTAEIEGDDLAFLDLEPLDSGDDLELLDSVQLESEDSLLEGADILSIFDNFDPDLLPGGVVSGTALAPGTAPGAVSEDPGARSSNKHPPGVPPGVAEAVSEDPGARSTNPPPGAAPGAGSNTNPPGVAGAAARAVPEAPTERNWQTVKVTTMGTWPGEEGIVKLFNPCPCGNDFNVKETSRNMAIPKRNPTHKANTYDMGCCRDAKVRVLRRGRERAYVLEPYTFQIKNDGKLTMPNVGNDVNGGPV